jgi:hypothetical protein
MKYSRKKNNLKKNLVKHKKTKKGGFNFFKSTPPPTTTQNELNNLQKVIQNTTIQNIENIMINEINQLKQKRENCVMSCKKSSVEYNDTQLKEQLNSMINEKSDYEWGNLCANSMKVSDCVEYLKSYKKIEFYKNYMDQVNKKIQNLFNDYKNNTSPNSIT